MRAVNLLPEKHRPRKATGGQSGSSYVLLGGLAAVVAAVLVYVLTVNGINDSKTAIAEAKAETARANATTDQLGAYGDFAKVKEQRASAIKTIAQGRADWERLVRELSVVLPDGVWLNTVSADDGSGSGGAGGSASGGAPAGPGGAPSAPAPGAAGAASGAVTATINGCADSQSKVAVTLVRLRQMQGATEVSLESSTRPETNAEPCGDNWEFTATATFAPEQGDAAAGVPDRLGGGA